MSITQINVETGEVTVLQEDAPSFPASRHEWREAASLPTMDRVRLKADFRAITHIRRAHPLMDGLGAAAGLTPEQIDTLFGWQDA